MALRNHPSLSAQQFKADLTAWISQYNIDLETPILFDLLRHMMEAKGIILPEVDEERHYFRSNEISYDEKKQTVQITTPDNITTAQLIEVLNYFQIPAHKHISGRSLAVSSEYFFQTIYPGMKALLADIYQTRPETLLNYQIESRNRLSETALREISKSLAPIRKECRVTIAEPDSAEDKFFGLILQLDTIVDCISSQNRHYSSDEKISPETFRDYLLKFNALETRVRALTNEGKYLEIVVNALNVYAKFNRNKALLAAMSFETELEKFLEQFGVHAGYCDILEHSLLLMANVTTIPTECKFDKRYNDPSRITFRIKGLNPAEGSQFIEWFRTQGDKTAGFDKDKKYKKYQMALGVTHASSAAEPEEPEFICEFDVDGEYLLQHIFPLLQEDMKKRVTAQPEWLKPYHNKSMRHFTKPVKLYFETALNELETETDEQPALSAEATEIKTRLCQHIRQVMAACTSGDMELFDKTMQTFLGNLPLAVNQSELQPQVIKCFDAFITKHKVAVLAQNNDVIQPVVETTADTTQPSLADGNVGRMFQPRDRKAQLEKVKELANQPVTREGSVTLQSGK